MPDLRNRAAFTEVFGAASDITANAPGRVNLIGEHTTITAASSCRP